jgi:hypothetical protein
MGDSYLNASLHGTQNRAKSYILSCILSGFAHPAAKGF